jgi:hypothetical protein
MKHRNRCLVAVLFVVSLLFLGCQKDRGTHHPEHPAEVERIAGSDLSKLTLTARAMERIDLKTVQVREVRNLRSASLRKVVPYSSLIYDGQGQTWIYTSPAPGTFVRQKVDVDYIDGDMAVLSDGPPNGTVVASVGVAELYGTEFTVGH